MPRTAALTRDYGTSYFLIGRMLARGRFRQAGIRWPVRAEAASEAVGGPRITPDGLRVRAATSRSARPAASSRSPRMQVRSDRPARCPRRAAWGTIMFFYMAYLLLGHQARLLLQPGPDPGEVRHDEGPLALPGRPLHGRHGVPELCLHLELAANSPGRDWQVQVARNFGVTPVAGLSGRGVLAFDAVFLADGEVRRGRDLLDLAAAGLCWSSCSEPMRASGGGRPARRPGDRS